MFRGKVMESGSLDAIYRSPEHPYLKALLNAVPRFGLAEGERLVPLREVKAETGNLIKPDTDRAAPRMTGTPLLKVDGLSKSFLIRKGSYFGSQEAREVIAVDDVSFEIARGECLGLVGESGCGKTTTSKMIMRALETDAGGVTFFDDEAPTDVLALKGRELKDFRRRVQFIFQDPFGSLNPRMTVFEIIAEPLVIHNIGGPESRAETVRELMRLVGLDPRFLNRYPHSFSGGQPQRMASPGRSP
jgi:ATPase components of various ABC-type transport systems, contain duplicated ATPase